MTGRDQSPVTREPYEQWRRRVLADNGEVLKNEFAALKSEQVAGSSTAFQANPKFNRYNNVPLLDETRVVLKDGLEGDYVHASRVGGYKAKNAFILTQAPLRDTVREYWRMVWQERVQVCVCLTAMQEDGVEKSTHFFPISTDRPFRAGPFRILLMGTEEQPYPRKLVVCRLKLYCWFAPSSRRERNIFLVMYGDWPDRGVPQNAAVFLDVFDGVRELQRNAWRQMRSQIDLDKSNPMTEPPPLLINCSAGIGRSATLAACFIEAERLRETQHVDLAACVRRIRAQRLGAVQNAMQYVFISRVLAEVWQKMTEEEEKTMAVTIAQQQSTTLAVP